MYDGGKTVGKNKKKNARVRSNCYAYERAIDVTYVLLYTRIAAYFTHGRIKIAVRILVLEKAVFLFVSFSNDATPAY